MRRRTSVRKARLATARRIVLAGQQPREVLERELRIDGNDPVADLHDRVNALPAAEGVLHLEGTRRKRLGEELAQEELSEPASELRSPQDLLEGGDVLADLQDALRGPLDGAELLVDLRDGARRPLEPLADHAARRLEPASTSPPTSVSRRSTSAESWAIRWFSVRTALDARAGFAPECIEGSRNLPSEDVVSFGDPLLESAKSAAPRPRGLRERAEHRRSGSCPSRARHAIKRRERSMRNERPGVRSRRSGLTRGDSGSVRAGSASAASRPALVSSRSISTARRHAARAVDLPGRLRPCPSRKPGPAW